MIPEIIVFFDRSPLLYPKASEKNLKWNQYPFYTFSYT